jgi:hypothetical protein
VELTLIGSSEVIASVQAAIPSALRTDDDDGALELSAECAVLAIPLKAIWEVSKTIWVKIMPFVISRPEEELTFEGPHGKISLKLKNVSEELIRETTEKVMLQARSTKRKP